MLRGIVAFELRYHARQLAFAVSVVIFAALGVALVASGYGPDGSNVNSPYVVAQALGLLSLASVFVLTVFCAGAAQRDTEHKMAEIVYMTSVDRFRYLAGRFAGGLLAAVAVMAAAAAGLMLAPLAVPVAAERMGPVAVLPYLWAMAVMVLPNLLFAGAVLFAVSALTRSALAGYVAGVFLYVLYLVAAIATDSPLMAGSAPASAEAMARAALLDPFGLSAFFEQTRYWTPAERNTRLLSLSGNLLLNRALWISVSLAILAAVHRFFAFRVTSGPRAARGASADASPSTAAPAYRPVSPDVRGAAWGALASATRLELRHVLRSWPFAALMTLWVFLVGMEIVGSTTLGEYATRLRPSAGLLLDGIRTPLGLVGTITILYYAAELVWRERAARADEIVDVTPASSAVFHLSKTTALVALAAAMVGSAVLTALAYQLLRGFPPQPGLLLSLFWFGGVPLALFAVAAVLVQTLSPNRYVGMLLSLLVAVVASRGPAIGLEHPLLQYGSAPVPGHSDMTGFGDGAAAFAWMMLYWCAFAALLGFLTVGAWRRGNGRAVWTRLARARLGWSRRSMAGAAACALVFVASGGFVFYHHDVLNEYETADEFGDWQADYERAYRHIDDLPQPSIVAVTADVDLYPERGRYDVAGTYRLENRSGRAVDTVWMAVRRDLASAELTLAGAPPSVRDARFGMHGFALAAPLAPGAGVEVAFRIRGGRYGMQVGAPERSVVANGTLLRSSDAFPYVGYRASYEMRDPAGRRARGLAGAGSAAEAAVEGEGAAGSEPWITLRTTVSTSADQIAVAPGVLRRTWTAEGRRYFRYETERPMTGRFGYVSARYAVRRVRHRGVDVEVYHHPAHAANVERIVRAATVSLDVFGARFGPYPHPQLRIAEVPGYWPFGAFAIPGVIWFPETRGFLTDARDGDPIDLVTRRVAHEVGHQWWGHQLDPADVPGASTLVESLAKYSEQRVLAEMHGAGSLPALIEADHDGYLRGRAGDPRPEVPLTAVTEQAYLYYGKGAVVFHALHDLMGGDAVDRALRRLLGSGTERQPAATTAELVAALKAEARPEHRALIDQWLTEVVVYDLKVDSARTERLPDGRWRVTARLSAGKTALRGGRTVPLPFDETLDIAVYARYPDGLASGEGVLHAEKHRVRGGAGEFSVIVAERPAYVAVDPKVRRIDPERGDNLREVDVPRFPRAPDAVPRPSLPAPSSRR